MSLALLDTDPIRDRLRQPSPGQPAWTTAGQAGGLIAVEQLREGDVIDLHGDAYADPDADTPGLEFEYAYVDAVEPETSTCVLVHTDAGSFGLPTGHQVALIERAAGE